MRFLGQSFLALVRFGSKADIRTAKGHVHFTPESGQMRCKNRCRFAPIADMAVFPAMPALLSKAKVKTAHVLAATDWRDLGRRFVP
jgi:hypothetical protein